MTPIAQTRDGSKKFERGCDAFVAKTGSLHRGKPLRRFDALDPGLNIAQRTHVEIGLMREVRVGKQHNISERQRIAAQKEMLAKLCIHQRQRRLAPCPLTLHQRPLFIGKVRLSNKAQPEPKGRDIGLVLVLLKEHPAKHIGLSEPFLRDQVRARGQIPARRIAFRQEARALTFAHLQNRDAAIGVDLFQKLRGARLAFEDVILPRLKRQAQKRSGQLDLIAIARARIFVEDEPLSHLPLPT